MKKICIVLFALYATALTPLTSACEGKKEMKATAEHQHDETDATTQAKS